MILRFIIGFLLLFVMPVKVYAASITSSILSPSQPFSKDTEITLNVVLNIEASDGTEYYLGGAIRKGSGNYCGYTLSEGSWIKYGGDGSKFQKVSILDNKWEGEMKVKIDTESSSCKESGEYKLKVKRYTNSSETFDAQTELAMNFDLPTPTNTPTPTPSPSSTPTPNPTNTPTPSPTNSPTPAPKLTPTATPKTTPRVSVTPEVMMANRANAQEPPQQGVQGESVSLGGDLGDLDGSSQGYNWWKLLIIMGTVIITGACGVFLYNNHVKERSQEIANE